VLSEYDALPEIGHACGHNLIAVSAVAAGIAIKAGLGESGCQGTVVILGTPAEEGGGGKVILHDKGGFEGVDIVMMVHPATRNAVYGQYPAIQRVEVIFRGKEAHASAYPHEGINALDAAVSAYVSISAMRQQIKSTDRVHGIIAEGGIKPNIIPARARMEYYVRSKTRKDLDTLQKKVCNCFNAAALATGCALELNDDGTNYWEVNTNSVIGDLYCRNIEKLGVKLPSKEDQYRDPGGSTDLGNISHFFPSIHYIYKIPSTEGNHHPNFTKAAATDEAHTATWVAAKGMAFTAIDIYTSPEIVQSAKDELAAKQQLV